VEVVADFVDGAVLWLREGAGLVECVCTFSARCVMNLEHVSGTHTLFEEEPHFVARVQKVLVPNVICAVLATSRELRHWVIVQREVIQHRVRVLKQFLDGILRQRVRYQQITILVEEHELFWRQPFDLWCTHCPVRVQAKQM
jgi:hypothetical protein